MRKAISVFMTLFFASNLLLAGCGGGESGGGASKPEVKSAPSGGGKQAVKIGFIVKQPEEPWFQMEHKFARQAAEELGFELLELAGIDGEKALAQIDNLGVQKAAGFVICTPDVKLGPAIMSYAKRNNMKVIAVDDRFIGNDGQPMEDVHYLGIAARAIGEDVGKALYEQLQARGWPVEETGVCAVTYEELDTAKERTDGAITALIEAGFPESQIYKAPQKTTDVNGALQAVDILLVQQPDVKYWLVCGMNDSAVLGAVRSMAARGFTHEDVCGIGINGTDCIDELKKENPTGFYGSMLLQAKKHGYETAKMMYEWVTKDQEPPLDTRTRGILITRENFREVLKDQGYEI
ncbi:substrate-binding domain-containing protein [Candidatus Sumerlaeota bacterium]|nr:substrate-binding domain-containing protein [Candidatus Sumerlaeota bacterium]